jgi:hypothetical protein
VLVAVLLIVPSAVSAQAPSPLRSNLVVFAGGSVEQLIAATGDDARSIWATVDGQFVGYTVGAPVFVNQAFLARFPGSQIGANTVLVVMMPASSPALPSVLQPADAPEEPQSSTGLSIISITSPIARNADASLTAQTTAGASCSITYIVPSGNVSTAQGLDDATAGSDGIVTWTWTIGGNTTPGTGSVQVTCAGESVTTTIVVQ